MKKFCIESDSSYTIVPVIDDILVNLNMMTRVKMKLELILMAGVEEVIGANPYLDQNIAPFVNLYSEIVRLSPAYVVGEATFADTRVTLKIAEVSELSPTHL